MSKQNKVIFALIACVTLSFGFRLSRNISGDEVPYIEATMDVIRNGVNKDDRAPVLVKIQDATMTQMGDPVLSTYQFDFTIIIGESSCLKAEYTPECKLDVGRPLRRCYATTFQTTTCCSIGQQSLVLHSTRAWCQPSS